eukprot:117337-Rhodomonas_salina.1
MLHVPVHSYGRCLHNIDLPAGFESARTGHKFWTDKVLARSQTEEQAMCCWAPPDASNGSVALFAGMHLSLSFFLSPHSPASTPPLS